MENQEVLEGLSSTEVRTRRRQYGLNLITTENKKNLLLRFLGKFFNPLILTLIFVALVSIILGERINSIIIILMAVLSVVFSFIQEHNASKAAEKLKAMVKITARVKRNGKIVEIPLSEIVPGDVVELLPGKMIPADLKIIEAKDLYINQSALNGESFPVRKFPGPDVQNHNLYDVANLAFMGSDVTTGFGQGLVLKTGKETQFGRLAENISAAPVTSFQKGINNFTWLMLRFTFILVFFIFVINSLFHANLVDSLLFSLAIAVGLTPEMLPMMVTINLSRGAIDMARKKVIVKELASIQNFGAMDILCADKTGTLTINKITLIKYCDWQGRQDDEILKLAYLNSAFQSGQENLIDEAIVDYRQFDLGGYQKIDELPFDFERRINSIVVKDRGQCFLISKGAPEEILKRSNKFSDRDNEKNIDQKIMGILENIYNDFSGEGFRVIALALKKIEQKNNYHREDEKELTFLGFLAFLDPPKTDAKEAIKTLENFGIKFKIITGDNELTSRQIAKELDFEILGSISGEAIDQQTDAVLAKNIEDFNLFFRVNPSQKERIIKALQKNNHTVGYLGDGINDAPSLKIADVGISVDNAADIAKETAQIILLKKSLTILADCVSEGRKTFANVIKYIKMGSSSNFGNMLSMTGASLFLPFLPMLPSQILLNNFLYDVSQIAIPTDTVDKDYLKKPRPWDIKFIKEFMLYIGPISSIFDFATFGVMWFVFHASPELFHTGWFIESLATQIFVVYIIRTAKIPFLESSPSKTLLFSTLGIVVFAVVLCYTSLGRLIGFTSLPILFFLILIVMIVLYLLLVQAAKGWFIRKFGYE